MDIRLFGPLGVRADDGASVDCGGIKQRSVLAQLALEPNTPVSLDRLAEGVWGETVPPRYRQNLQVYVSTLRRVVEPHRVPGTTGRIVGHTEAYELILAPHESDVGRMNAAVSQATAELKLGKPRRAAELLAGAVPAAGDPLADLAAQPFAASWIEHLHAQRLTATERLLEARLALSEHREIVDELEHLVARHPGHERLWELLALALVRCGRQQDALTAVRRATNVLIEQYGIDPGPVLGRLEEQILNQDPQVLGLAPPAAAAAAVPVPLTPAVGRGQSVAAALAVLAGGARLLVLAGPGGVGKTRLALDVLHSGDRAVAGAVWVPFADEPSDAGVEAVVARRLGVAFADLGTALGAIPLLALDNLEHVADAVPAVARLLATHPGLRVIATSRGPLGIPGEQVLRVTPLDEAAAVELFAMRARSVLPEFTLDETRTTEVRGLCRQLDHLPLAIELAAARVVTLAPRELLQTLPSVSELASETAHGRQSSVEATVGWSIGLLTEPQRAALTAVAAVEGSLNVGEAAAVIRAFSGDTASAPLRSVEALTRLGLVLPLETASGRRFAVLHVIRAVVAPTPADERRAALALAGHWAQGDTEVDAFGGWVRAESLAGLDDDLPLLRIVLGALLAESRTAEAAQLALVRRRGLMQLGRSDVLSEWCSMLMAAGLDEPWLSRVRVVAGSVAYTTYQAGAATLLAAVADLDPADLGYRVIGHSFRSVLLADEDPAAARAESEAAISAAGHEANLEQVAHSSAGWVALMTGQPTDAVRHAEVCVRLARDDLQKAIALHELARAEIAAGNPARAVALLDAALRLSRTIGDNKALAEARTVLGIALLHLDTPAEALEPLRLALRRAAEMSDVGWVLELVCAIGIAVSRADQARQVHGHELIRQANAVVVQLGIEDSAIPPDLESMAGDLHLAPWDPAVPAPTVESLVDRAMELARRARDATETGDVPDVSVGGATARGHDRQ